VRGYQESRPGASPSQDEGEKKEGEKEGEKDDKDGKKLVLSRVSRGARRLLLDIDVVTTTS
jgi:hypothetical protein